ncbi:MAG: non-canonical purine NTP pyrophosphatase [Gemmatimonadaceae bacterium]
MLATRSAGKLRELRPIFAAVGVGVLDLAEAGVDETPAEDAIESFDTFEENALAKARYFFERCGGLDVVADDSGLAVDALGGEPGVRSKRWSERADLSGPLLDAANNERLMATMRGLKDRRARFVCAAAWRGSHGEAVGRGEVRGRIMEQASGTHGFGYDPYFFADELGMTLADATTEQKRGVSHRGRAFDALLETLRARGVLATRGRTA